MVRIKTCLMKRLILISIIALTSCKAVERYKASPEFAKDCGEAFPPRQQTIFVPGIPVHDTVDHYVQIDCDTVAAVIIDTVVMPRIVTAKCPPSITIRQVDTIKITVENTAKITSLDRELQRCLDNLDRVIDEKRQWQAKAKKRFWWLIILLAAALGWYFRRSIIKLFKR